MPKGQCDNYEICSQYGIYGKCQWEDNNLLHATCDVFEKQTLTILASIDEKLSKLLEKKEY